MDLDDIPMKRTVLAVDDEELLRHYVARVIANEGYRVFVAGDGLDALALFDLGAPPIDLVITDILMPGMDGVELARRLAILAPAPQVLFVTGGHGLSDLPGPVLWKPFLADDLRTLVRRLLDDVPPQNRSDQDSETARFARRSAQPGLTCTGP
jgi:two-component system cell cycle sensor histidine kinase/response regulator CckA